MRIFLHLDKIYNSGVSATSVFILHTAADIKTNILQHDNLSMDGDTKCLFYMVLRQSKDNISFRKSRAIYIALN